MHNYVGKSPKENIIYFAMRFDEHIPNCINTSCIRNATILHEKTSKGKK